MVDLPQIERIRGNTGCGGTFQGKRDLVGMEFNMRLTRNIETIEVYTSMVRLSGNGECGMTELRLPDPVGM